VILMMLMFVVADDSVYGGVGVRPAVLRQCDNYNSNQPKWLRTTNINGTDNTCIQE